MNAITILNVTFQQKDAVKSLAYKNKTRILWNPTQKFWYWEGEEENLPEFLHPYHPATQLRKQQEEELARKAEIKAREADRYHAYELEKQGKLKEALGILKTCYFAPRYDGEQEIYRHEDITRIEAKITDEESSVSTNVDAEIVTFIRLHFDRIRKDLVSRYREDFSDQPQPDQTIDILIESMRLGDSYQNEFYEEDGDLEMRYKKDANMNYLRLYELLRENKKTEETQDLLDIFMPLCK